MSELCCQICLDAFDEKENCPRVVNCGHTFCTKCIDTLAQSDESCPNCNTKMSHQNCEDFPVNYYLLQTDFQVPSSSKIKTEAENFKKLHNFQIDISALKANLLDTKKRNSVNWSLVENAVKKLKMLFKELGENGVPSIEEFKSIEDLISEVRSNIKCDCKTSTLSLLKKVVSLWSDDFESPEMYLIEIYKGIANDKRFVAVLIIDDNIKHAKLSIHDNYLLIHAFEDVETELSSMAVCYKELLDKLTNNKCGITNWNNVDHVSDMNASCYGFLDLTYDTNGRSRRAFIEILPESNLRGAHFLNLCTGNEGISYKNSHYEKILDDNEFVQGYTTVGGQMFVKLNFNWDMKEMDAVFKFVLRQENTLSTTKTYAPYLIVQDDGSFEIFEPYCIFSPHSKFELLSLSKVVGTVRLANGLFSSIFTNASNGKVMDCGIAIRL